MGFLNCRDLGLWVVLKCKERESQSRPVGRPAWELMGPEDVVGVDLRKKG